MEKLFKRRVHLLQGVCLTQIMKLNNYEHANLDASLSLNRWQIELHLTDDSDWCHT